MAGMNTHDVAAYLGVSRQRIDQLVRAEACPVPKIVAGRRTWTRRSIDRWAKARWRATKHWRVQEKNTLVAHGSRTVTWPGDSASPSASTESWRPTGCGSPPTFRC
jgi:predicted DNA-binding transcriptional regulator AlpA